MLRSSLINAYFSYWNFLANPPIPVHILWTALLLCYFEICFKLLWYIYFLKRLTVSWMFLDKNQKSKCHVMEKFQLLRFNNRKLQRLDSNLGWLLHTLKKRNSKMDSKDTKIVIHNSQGNNSISRGIQPCVKNNNTS